MIKLFLNYTKLYNKLYDIKLYDNKLYDIKLYDIKLYDIKLYDIKLYDIKLYDIKAAQYFLVFIWLICLLVNNIIIYDVITNYNNSISVTNQNIYFKLNALQN